MKVPVNPYICRFKAVQLEILKAMKRGYTKEWYLNRELWKIRSLCKDVTISTDIIVAFPGESDKDFEDTLDVMREVRFMLNAWV